MKTKIFSLFLMLVISVGTIFASNTQVGGIWYDFNGSNLTAAVTYRGSSYSAYSNEYSGTVTIPSSVTYNGWTYSVTSIGVYAFRGCNGLTSVTIPNSVTDIEGGAFESCTGLTSVTIPNSVTYIRGNAFSGCTGLTSVHISDISSWCAILFYNANSNPLYYAHNLYMNGFLITHLSIPSSVHQIGNCAFQNCTSLSSVTIPNSVTYIGSSAFSGCTGLSYVTIPNSVTDIDGTAFADCTGLSNVTIPNSINSIENGVFSGCKGLTSVTIPNSVTRIRYSAFSGCTGLTSVTIPNSVTDIGDNAFESVNNIVYSGTATGAPWGAKSINGYVDGYLVYRDNSKTELLGCSSVRIGKISLPNSVTSIGDYAFADCIRLTSVTIPNSVTSIGTDAFLRCTGLTSITIPDSVTSIRERTFYGCTGLISFTIGNNVTSIGEYAFYGCTGLTSVTIGNSVTSIGQAAFRDCSGLTSVHVSDIASWCAINFLNDYSNPLYYAHNLYKNGNLITDLVIPSNVTQIKNYTFYRCSGLISVTIPNSVTSIGNSAFVGCSGLIDIYVNCGDLDRLKNLLNNDNRVKYIPLPYKITTKADNGQISCPQNICEALELSAVPNYGYHFIRWSDGRTDNPRTFELTQDTTFTAEFAKNTYTITTESDNPEWGTANGGKSALYLDNVEISATANYGYHFVEWNDGNTQNPRTVTATEDKTYTATFAKNTYNITKNAEQGTISGPSQAQYLDTVTLTANPNYGYHFAQWSDGETVNPRDFVLTQDTTITAEFAIDKSGTCGENLSLNWAFEDSTKTLTISGSGALTENYTFGLEAPTQMEHLVIGNDVTAIGDSAFYGKTTIAQVTIGGNVTSIGNYAFADIDNRQLTSIVMPAELTTIGDYAFSGNTYLESIDFNAKLLSIGAYAFKDCRRVSEMTCMAETTPDVGTNALSSINSYASLCVPASCVRKYQVDPNWGRFDLCELGATTSTGSVTTVIVEPSDNTALFTWPTENDAATYTLQITKDGEVFCTLVFNANGQLTGIAFAPSRTDAPHAPAATLSNGAMQFTVTGLNVANKYAYHLAVTDDSNVELQSYSGEFATTGYEGEVNPGGEPESGHEAVDQLHQDPASNTHKLLRNGQILILRGDRTYTVTGQEVRQGMFITSNCIWTSKSPSLP